VCIRGLEEAISRTIIHLANSRFEELHDIYVDEVVEDLKNDFEMRMSLHRFKRVFFEDAKCKEHAITLHVDHGATNRHFQEACQEVFDF
jgi:hypothetical protein